MSVAMRIASATGSCFSRTQPVAERFALDVGHDVEDRAIYPARVEQRQDVGVLQVGGGLDFLEEPLGPDQGRELGKQDLDGDFAIVAGIVGEKYRGHAAAAQLAFE